MFIRRKALVPPRCYPLKSSQNLSRLNLLVTNTIGFGVVVLANISILRTPTYLIYVILKVYHFMHNN